MGKISTQPDSLLILKHPDMVNYKKLPQKYWEKKPLPLLRQEHSTRISSKPMASRVLTTALIIADPSNRYHEHDVLEARKKINHLPESR